MTLETECLILRRWEDSDAEDLFKYASDPDVGPIAGWPAHQSIKESRDVIRNVFNGKEAYAICLKEDGKAIGAIELKLNGNTDMTERDDECELGYWLGKPFWGQGIMPEAAREMLRHAFEDIGMTKVWCGYYEGNTKSKRVQEKVGFRYLWTTKDVDVPLMHEKRVGHVSCITREEWKHRLYMEDVIKRYFAAWIDADVQPVKEIFSENIVYSECYGPEYHGLDQIVRWFEEWNNNGRVLEWTIKRVLTVDRTLIAEWYFKCDYGGSIDGFDGVTLADFDDNNRITKLCEFQSKAEHYCPYSE